MKLKLLMIVGVVAQSFAICAISAAAERHSDMVVAQAQPANPNDKDKQPQPGAAKKPGQPAAKPPAHNPVVQQQQKPVLQQQQKPVVQQQQKPVQQQQKPVVQQQQKPVQQQQKPVVQQQQKPVQQQQKPVVQQQQKPVQQQQKPVVQQQQKPVQQQQKPVVQQQQKPVLQQQQKPVVQQQPAQLETKKPAGIAPQKPVQIETKKPTTLQQPGIVPPQKPVEAQKPTFDQKKGTVPAIQAQQHPILAPADRRLDKVRGERHETHEGNRTIIKEQNRTIIRENGHVIIRHDDLDRFRHGARDVHVEHRGNETETIIIRPDGDRIVTIVDADGRLLRRFRRDRDGREIILIDNRHEGPRGSFNFILSLPPAVVHIPRDRYIVDANRADRVLLYDTLIAPPVMHIDRRYTLDEIRFTHVLRERMPRIDLDTITFETGSWNVTPDQAQLLGPIGEAMKRAISRNPNEIYMIEGHTDAVGSDVDNLSLSDRRAESVASILSEDFGIPPENLTTQGYGEQYLKIPTQGPERRNRRVTVRRITPLLTGQN